MRKLLCYFGIHSRTHYVQESMLPVTTCCDKEVVYNYDRMLPNRFKCRLGLHNLPITLSEKQPLICSDCGKEFKKVVTHYE